MKSLTQTLKDTLKTFFAVSMIASGVTSYADDTEVFYSVNASKPNLLFILDVSGSMSTTVTSSASIATYSQDIVHADDDAFQIKYNSIQLHQNTITIDEDDNASARFRFTNIDIPEDANIIHAYIQFEAAADNSGDADFKVYSERTDNAPRTVASHWGLSYYQSDRWEIRDSWSDGDRGANQRVDVTDVAQSVINRSGWNEGNAIAFYLDEHKGVRSLAAFDDPNRAPPKLVIEYDVAAKDRLEIMQESLRAVLEKSPDNVKVGLMNYGLDRINPEVDNNYPENRRHHSVSGITFPVTDINAKARDIIPTSGDVHGLPSFPDENITIREYLADVADSWDHTSYTPIVDALYEAALYYRGEKIHYGQNLPTINGAHPSTYDGPVVTTDVHVGGRDKANAPKYITPIESSCQENYIVLMTDGAPTYRYSGWNSDEGPFARIRGTTNGPQGALASAIGSCSTAVGVGRQGNCGAEITNYLATHDNLPDPTGSFPNGQEGDQFIGTYTIGFGIGSGSSTENYLKSLATIDDGNASTLDDGYFPAQSPEDLAAAFAEILLEVAAPKGTLASPGYSVNVKSGLEHEKDIYIPVFDRKNAARWSGNLKKFKIVDEGGRRKIKGSNGQNAVDELGGFTSNALDYWSSSPPSNPDGKAVQKGGLANLLNPTTRNLYSDLAGSGNLYSTANHISEANISNISNSTLGLPSTATLNYRKEIVNFMRGWKAGEYNGSANPPGEPRYHMGDMLHSEPLVITYNQGSGSNSTGKQQYIFAGTNEGYLHAFDTITGEEKWAFMPSELLSTIAESQYLNAGTQKDHKYGVDGTLTYWFKGGEDGAVNSGDQIILYVGLRRGGSSYYALDVTNINQPKLLWKKSVSDYASMGQSWSAPYLGRVGVGEDGEGKEVVIISGGYDPDEDRNKVDSLEVDDATTTVTADVGNDILILDAKNGNLIWSMSSAQRGQIDSSIPGGVRILDTNYNQTIDRLYFADTGGNVWRLDLSEKIGAIGASSTLTKLADVGGSTRKFFNEPDVAVMKLNGKSVFAVSVGSGFRAHPLDKSIDDKFYILVDESPFAPLEDEGETAHTPITAGELATITIGDSGVTQGGSIKDVGKRGWKVNLPESGEKVLATAVTFDGVVTFTTLVPEVLTTGVGIDQCAAPATQGRFYAINILSGEAGLDLDLSGSSGDPYDPESITDADIFITIAKGEIPGKPQTVFNPLEVVGDTCTHPVDIRIGKKLSQATGYDACRLESVYWSDPVTDR